MPCELVKAMATDAVARMQKNSVGLDLAVNYIDPNGELTESQFGQAMRLVEKQWPSTAPQVTKTQVDKATYAATPIKKAIAVNLPNTGTKAGQVRAMIAAAKERSATAESVIAEAMGKLDMARSQAAKYVSENWSRV